ncbi:hypothetical protein GCM10009550_35260 [Actinocorallia libanotica]|uniref:Uncharacterized protein n=1 Tax=Actinocorallia libanotica TaxID=46162 RepID=A0ABP4BRX6_9ACTN
MAAIPTMMPQIPFRIIMTETKSTTPDAAAWRPFIRHPFHPFLTCLHGFPGGVAVKSEDRDLLP